MPVELAVSLSALALYDIVIYADDSGSMTTGDGERIEDLKLIVAKVAEVATLFDEDGIAVSPQFHQLAVLYSMYRSKIRSTLLGTHAPKPPIPHLTETPCVAHTTSTTRVESNRWEGDGQWGMRG